MLLGEVKFGNNRHLSSARCESKAAERVKISRVTMLCASYFEIEEDIHSDEWDICFHTFELSYKENNLLTFE